MSVLGTVFLAERELRRRGLHRRVRDAHLRHDRADRAAHGGAWQQDRRRRHGHRRGRDAAAAWRVPRLGHGLADHPGRRHRHGHRHSGRAEGAHDRDASDGGHLQRRGRRRGGADRLGGVPPPLRPAVVLRGPCARRSSSCSGRSSGSLSFWGSNIAFGKLQEILPGRPIKLPGQSIINLVLLLITVVSVRWCWPSGTHSEALFILGHPGRGGGAGQHGRAADRRRGHAGGHLTA